MEFFIDRMSLVPFLPSCKDTYSVIRNAAGTDITWKQSVRRKIMEMRSELLSTAGERCWQISIDAGLRPDHIGKPELGEWKEEVTIRVEESEFLEFPAAVSYFVG
jgi:hypothetical protein